MGLDFGVRVQIKKKLCFCRRVEYSTEICEKDFGIHASF